MSFRWPVPLSCTNGFSGTSQMSGSGSFRKNSGSSQTEIVRHSSLNMRPKTFSMRKRMVFVSWQAKLARSSKMQKLALSSKSTSRGRFDSCVPWLAIGRILHFRHLSAFPDFSQRPSASPGGHPMNASWLGTVGIFLVDRVYAKGPNCDVDTSQQTWSDS